MARQAPRIILSPYEFIDLRLLDLGKINLNRLLTLLVRSYNSNPHETALS